MAKGLGKGLSALIADKDDGELLEVPTIVASERDSLPLDVLHPGKFQPRLYFDEEELQELAESIKKNGVVQPILVRAVGEEGQYEIVAGERRWRAAKMVNLATIPVIILELDDRKALEIALVENIQRKNLHMLEEAEGYQRLIEEFDYTQEGLAEVIGKSRSQISNTLRLLSLPNEVKTLLNDEKITPGHARAMLMVEDPVRMADIVVKRDLNVRQTEKLVKKMANDSQPTRQITLKDPEVRELEQELSKKLGLELTVTNKGEGGKIIITYHTLQELDSVLRRLERDL